LKNPNLICSKGEFYFIMKLYEEFKLYETMWESVDDTKETGIASNAEMLKYVEKDIARKKQQSDSFDSDDSDDIIDTKEDFDKILSLARSIFGNRDFKCTTRTDLPAHQKSNTAAVTYRNVYDGITRADGDKQKFLAWVDNKSKFAEFDKEMFHAILD
jgi:hypothetical protein